MADVLLGAVARGRPPVLDLSNGHRKARQVGGSPTSGEGEIDSDVTAWSAGGIFCS